MPRRATPILAFLLLLARPALAQWTEQKSSTTARLRGLSVVDGRTAWASGAGGTVLLTTDAGATWTRRPVPESESLDFRDVEAFDARRACVLSIGEGDKSRIYRTADGGATWDLVFTNRDPAGFLDAFAFWGADHGLALGDPVAGRFTILATSDAGRTWTRPPLDGLPPSLPGEGAFAASGTCLTVFGDRHAWFGTGGGGTARVFRSSDRGQTWTVHPTPIRADSPSRGVFSLAFLDPDHGLAVGGDYKEPDRAVGHWAITSDGGRTWRTPDGPGPRGYRSAVTLRKLGAESFALSVGPAGADFSRDGGANWQPFGDLGFHAAALASDGSGWAVGEEGLIGRLEPVDRQGRRDR